MLYSIYIKHEETYLYGINVNYLHLDIKDPSLLLNLLLDGCHGLVKDRQALCALQSGCGHHIARWSNQVDLYTITQCYSYIGTQVRTAPSSSKVEMWLKPGLL